MPKILIATTNNSKFEVVKELLISCGFENYNFKLLKDLDLIIEDKKENGNILERAKDKAVNVYNTINNSKYNNDFEYIIGIDEGIEILTGVPAGKKDKDGNFPAGTVNYLIYEKLKKYARVCEK